MANIYGYVLRAFVRPKMSSAGLGNTYSVMRESKLPIHRRRSSELDMFVEWICVWQFANIWLFFYECIFCL